MATLPPFDYTPMPYDGPSPEEILALRQAHVNPGIFHYYKKPVAIVEKFSDMHDDLEKERKTITKLWAKREEQIDRVMQATVGMYGDLQGIAGKTLQEIEGLEFQEALESPVEEDEPDPQVGLFKMK